MALYDAGEMGILDERALSIRPSRYGEARPVRWPLLAAVLSVHILVAAALDMTGLVPNRRAPSELKLIQLSPDAPPPPVAVETQLPPPPSVASTMVRPVTPVVDAPPPVVATPVAPPAAIAIVQPAPPPAPAPDGPLRVADLDAKAVTVVPPKYPIESRRKREQGTVVLAVTLAMDGGVAAVGLARSSGFERLDKAALDAVRRWRWSPTLRDGVAVAVRGTVEIPFVLRG